MSAGVVIQEISGNPTAEEEAAIRAALEKLAQQLSESGQSKPSNKGSQWVRYHRARARTPRT